MNYIKFYEKWIEEDPHHICLKITFLFKRSLKTQKVDYWLLEVNEDGRIIREIGIGDQGLILSIAPFNSNRGQWVDSQVSLNPDEYISTDEQEFNEKWELALKTL